MSCGSARLFIQESLDGPVSPPDEAMLETHMANCWGCRHYKESLKRITAAMGQLPSERSPRDFAASVRLKIGQERNAKSWRPLLAAAAIVVGFVAVRPLIGQGSFDLAKGSQSSRDTRGAAELRPRVTAVPPVHAEAKLVTGLPDPMPPRERMAHSRVMQAGSATVSGGLASARSVAYAVANFRTYRPHAHNLAHRHAVDMATFEFLRWMDPAADSGPNFDLLEVDFAVP